MLYAGEHGRITAREYSALAGVSDVTVYRDLKDLCEKGLLVRHGKGRGTYYALAG
jgi:DeoR/GlpR family transcriptional regulator of sugar metabolism